MYDGGGLTPRRSAVHAQRSTNCAPGKIRGMDAASVYLTVSLRACGRLAPGREEEEVGEPSDVR